MIELCLVGPRAGRMLGLPRPPACGTSPRLPACWVGGRGVLAPGNKLPGLRPAALRYVGHEGGRGLGSPLQCM